MRTRKCSPCTEGIYSVVNRVWETVMRKQFRMLMREGRGASNPGWRVKESHSEDRT